MSPSFTLYGDRGSGNCLKVWWLARHLGETLEWVEVSVLDSETRTDAFLKRNPAGQVPCAVFDDGHVLAQSNAILLHLAERADSALIPSDPFARAKMYEWLFWEQYSHETAIAVRRYKRVYLKLTDEEIDPGLLERGHAALALMNRHLEVADFFPGFGAGTGSGLEPDLGPDLGRPSLADLALVAYTRLAPESGFSLELYPHVAAWIGRVEAHFGIDESRPS